MKKQIKSIRPFIGAENFKISRQFYLDLGFLESVISSNLSYFSISEFGFYLQDAFVKDWIDNTMIFMEVENVEKHWLETLKLNLTAKYETVRLVPIRHLDWGKEFFLHDPSGILWHFGQFY